MHCRWVGSAIDCLPVYRIDYTDTASLCYHGSVWKNKDMWGNTKIGVVIHGRIRTWCLCFTYTPFFTVSFIFRVE